MGRSSEEGDYRHPLYYNSEPLKNLEVLLVTSSCRQAT